MHILTKFKNYRLKVTTARQYEILVDFFLTHSHLAKGRIQSVEARKKAGELWEDLSKSLNAVGPPLRDVNGWKKVHNYLSFYFMIS